jgi:hypothetical protein
LPCENLAKAAARGRFRCAGADFYNCQRAGFVRCAQPHGHHRAAAARVPELSDSATTLTRSVTIEAVVRAVATGSSTEPASARDTKGMTFVITSLVLLWGAVRNHEPPLIHRTQNPVDCSCFVLVRRPVAWNHRPSITGRFDARGPTKDRVADRPSQIERGSSGRPEAGSSGYARRSGRHGPAPREGRAVGLTRVRGRQVGTLMLRQTPISRYRAGSCRG